MLLEDGTAEGEGFALMGPWSARLDFVPLAGRGAPFPTTKPAPSTVCFSLSCGVIPGSHIEKLWNFSKTQFHDIFFLKYTVFLIFFSVSKRNGR